MARRPGIQTEVLLGLALVMVLATVLLSAVWIARHEATLRSVLGRALLAEARGPHRGGPGGAFAGTAWWIVGGDGTLRPQGSAGAAGPEELALAAQVRERRAPLLQPGPVWSPVRFAAPVGTAGDVAVARLPREASLRLRTVPLAVGLGVVVVDAAIFTIFGAAVLRRRVLGPLERLAAAARELAAGASGTRAAVEGPRETAELARAFNEMTDALEGRSEALAKAVVELREANEELRRARADLERADRLAAVGRLAAGVAHEVGNPIGAILALTDLAARDPGLSDKGRGHLARAAREGARVRAILTQLLDFSRPPRAAAPSALDLAEMARQAVGLLEAQPRYQRIGFQVEAAPGVAPARGDAGAVSQILLNLLLNAADAVAGAAQPQVRLRIEPCALRVRAGDPDPAQGSPARRRLDGVACVVADNGCGIAAEDRERIFDPFFTTKDPGEGTGLGLANAHRLAEELAGRLTLVEPPEGFQTAFALGLPAFGAAEPARGSARAAD